MQQNKTSLIQWDANSVSLTCFPLIDLNFLYNCTMVTAQYQVCLTLVVLQIGFPHRSTRNLHLRGQFQQFRYKRRESQQSFASTTWVTLDRDGSETGHVSTGTELLLHGTRHVSNDASIGYCVMAKMKDDISVNLRYCTVSMKTWLIKQYHLKMKQ